MPSPQQPDTHPASGVDANHWFVQLPDQRQFGPLTKPELDLLVGQGTLTPAALCWCSSSEGWCPLSQLYPLLAPHPAPTTDAPPGLALADDARLAMLHALDRRNRPPRTQKTKQPGFPNLSPWTLALLLGLTASTGVALVSGRYDLPIRVLQFALFASWLGHGIFRNKRRPRKTP